ncbi:unnamed protein product [Coccothraustes coccothraustes]
MTANSRDKSGPTGGSARSPALLQRAQEAGPFAKAHRDPDAARALGTGGHLSRAGPHAQAYLFPQHPEGRSPGQTHQGAAGQSVPRQPQRQSRREDAQWWDDAPRKLRIMRAEKGGAAASAPGGRAVPRRCAVLAGDGGVSAAGRSAAPSAQLGAQVRHKCNSSAGVRS